MNNKTCLIFCSRLPIKGAGGKSRISMALYKNKAGESLSNSMIEDLVSYFQDIGDLDFIWYCLGQPTDEIKQRYPVSYMEQIGESLGDKLNHAAKVCSEKHEQILFVGGDCVYVDEALIHQVKRKLKFTPVVIVPAKDGGYVLLAMRGYHDLFSTIKNWDSRSENYHLMGDTLKLCADNGISVSILNPVSDIDELDDVKELAEKIKKGESLGKRLPRTKDWLVEQNFIAKKQELVDVFKRS
jgi:glycosyltransferase A (GT-A) superfamily protein (DUF2064 family)